MSKQDIFFIQDFDIAIENEMRGDGRSFYCDRNGTIYEVDMVVHGEEELAHYTQNDTKIIGRFSEINSLVSFGMHIYESAAGSNDYGESINKHMYRHQYSEKERAAVAEAHKRFFGRPLPPYNPAQYLTELPLASNSMQ